MPLLTAEEILLRLKRIPNWSHQDLSIQRTYQFKGFLQSIYFVNRVAKKAQRLNHHPDMDIRYSKVTLTLTSHEAGGITENDFTLARQCDEVYSHFERNLTQDEML